MWKCKNVDRKQDWKDNPTKAEVIQRLDSYRAIEIGNLWQRSVFLGSFLLLGYTGYGFLLGNAIDPNGDGELEMEHFFACVLACINVIFSILWIMMAKGSKAWYQVYENAIRFVEDAKDPLEWKQVRCEIDLRRRTSTIKDQCEKRCCENFKNNKNDSLFSSSAGGYSPSKINIALGQISLGIWAIVFVGHFIAFCLEAAFTKECCLVVSVVVILIMTAIVISRLIGGDWIKSSYFID